MQSATFRLATEIDLENTADLRWRLTTGDAFTSDDELKKAFMDEFRRDSLASARKNQLYHWIVERHGQIMGVMSVIIVRALPSPDEPVRRWGYLTNCYISPQLRNLGIGSALLSTIETWARAERLELLVVWPSDRAYPLYERSRFERREDPLVLLLDDAEQSFGDSAFNSPSAHIAQGKLPTSSIIELSALSPK